MITISVITPSFNHDRFIKRAIDSVQAQRGAGTKFKLEHIVMDGGSTDGTVGLLREYGPAVRWVSEKDNGQADALNRGLALAGGDVIGWLNSDDAYEPGALETVAAVFESEPATQWVYGKVRIIDEADREIRRWITAYKNFRMRRYRYGKLLAENWVSQMGVFWRRSAGQAAGPFRVDLHYCMDYDFWLRLGARWAGRFIDQYLAAFRWYATSKSGAGFGKQFREELNVAIANAAGKYPWSILRHRVNYFKIVAAYNLMRWLRR